jgi:antitoxin component of RelBE/YafQ-DinJ toxin-antitoxin module
MNITLAIDEKVAERARAAAAAMGKSLNQAVRDYLESLARADQIEAEIEAFRASAYANKASLNGWKFDREEANERR